jgi:hypothetical protein
VIEKLKNHHWMFAGSAGQSRARVLMMCEDCRVQAVVNESFDPHSAPQRPKVRTAEDYLAERATDRIAIAPSSEELDPLTNS